MPKENWSSRLSFVLSGAALAVGVANFWRFPYLIGRYGGGTFLLAYVAVAILFGVPLVAMELALGRHTRREATGALALLAPRSPWPLLGVGFVVYEVISIGYYATVVGWMLAYTWHSATGAFAGAGMAQMARIFAATQANPVAILALDAVILAFCGAVIVRGVTRGIERFCKLAMPALLALICFLAVYGLSLPGAASGLAFYFTPRPGTMGVDGLLAAIGQVFFSVNIGMGGWAVFGSHLSRRDPILGNALWVTGLDTAIAFLAGFVIFPAVFTFGADPGQGASLAFVTMPALLDKLPAGPIVSVLFFALLFLAGFASAVTSLEVAIAFAEERLHLCRRLSVPLFMAVMFLAAVPPAMAYGPWSGVRILGRNIFDFEDFLIFSVSLPLMAVLLSLFVGWRWGADAAREEINRTPGPVWVGRWWNLVIKYVAPVVIGVVLVVGVLHGLHPGPGPGPGP
ncbi:MAG: sodium-dependent transporter [Bacillota bacterium]